MSISDFDLYLFGEGSNRRIYDQLGAHPETVNGVAGTRFAVWAPNAERVSVVGPFNAWDGGRNVLSGRGVSGVWELFVPFVTVGALYKFEIRTRSGGLFLKSDPYGFQMQLRPENCSIVASLDDYTWHDADWLARRAEANAVRRPFNAYEVHLGSWRRPWLYKSRFSAFQRRRR